MNEISEKNKILNPTTHILVPRLIERKKEYNSNPNKAFLNNKRYLKSNSEGKKKYI